jgi:hypothetical protein
MSAIIRNVPDISPEDRRALEHVLGRALRDDEQITISVAPAVETNSPAGQVDLPDWLNLYEGLSDAEIAELEGAILRRADLTRTAE